jgi:hypothetical protein
MNGESKTRPRPLAKVTGYWSRPAVVPSVSLFRDASNLLPLLKVFAVKNHSAEGLVIALGLVTTYPGRPLSGHGVFDEQVPGVPNNATRFRA